MAGLTDAQMQQFMAAQQAETREQVLYQFNAGTMEMKGKTVTADPRKGKVIISSQCPRASGKTEAI